MLSFCCCAIPFTLYYFCFFPADNPSLTLTHSTKLLPDLELGSLSNCQHVKRTRISNVCHHPVQTLRSMTCLTTKNYNYFHSLLKAGTSIPPEGQYLARTTIFTTQVAPKTKNELDGENLGRCAFSQNTHSDNLNKLQSEPFLLECLDSRKSWLEVESHVPRGEFREMNVLLEIRE